MITSIKLAYKIGFSAALGAAWGDMDMVECRNEWQFKLGKTNKELLKAFRRGFSAGVLEYENLKANG